MVISVYQARARRQVRSTDCCVERVSTTGPGAPKRTSVWPGMEGGITPISCLDNPGSEERNTGEEGDRQTRKTASSWRGVEARLTGVAERRRNAGARLANCRLRITEI